MTMFNDSCGRFSQGSNTNDAALNSVFSVQVALNASSFTHSCFNYDNLCGKEKRAKK